MLNEHEIDENETFGESLIRGMQEVIAFAKGEETGAIVHIPEQINVNRIRKKLDMTQALFASYFGVSPRTVQEWEQGRRVPSGAAKNFLIVIDKEPEAVRRALMQQ